VFGDAGEQLKLRYREPEGGVGRAGGPAHGPAQPGHDIGQLGADLLRTGLPRAGLPRTGLPRAGLIPVAILAWA
jgi:hypothetical protein